MVDPVVCMRFVRVQWSMLHILVFLLLNIRSVFSFQLNLLTRSLKHTGPLFPIVLEDFIGVSVVLILYLFTICI